MNLTTMLESSARRFATKPAIEAGERVITFAELIDLTKRAAAALRDGGVRPGDRVAVMTRNTPAFIIAAFGIYRAGATLVPINHKLSSAEVGYLLRHCEATCGIVADDLLATAAADTPSVTWLTTTKDGAGTFDLALEAAPPWQGHEVADDDVAQILYTSGTTARPKGCVHTHRGLAQVAAFTTATLGLRPADRFLAMMPLWHASPLNNWLGSAIFVGGTSVLIEEYHPVEFLQVATQSRATVTFGAPVAYLVPLQLAKAGKLDLAAFDLSAMRVMAYGGAPITPEQAGALEAQFGSGVFHQVYGMSEMGPVGVVLFPAEQLTKAGCIGHCGMLGVDMRVVDETGRDAGPGEIGEIWLRSDTRMRGYLDDAEATAMSFAGPWYRSGDVARIDDDGYLTIVDRLKDVVITGGENVFCGEVEEAIMALPEVTEAAVLGRPHDVWGQTVVAVATLADGQKLTLDQLQEALGTRLAKYKMPRELVICEQLPRTPSGKVMKHVLREELFGGAGAA